LNTINRFFSGVFNLVITVKPIITGQKPLTVEEDNPLTIGLSELISSNDPEYPAGYTLTVRSGDYYSVSGTTITQSKDFNIRYKV
jgi:hypothetical protein